MWCLREEKSVLVKVTINLRSSTTSELIMVAGIRWVGMSSGWNKILDR